MQTHNHTSPTPLATKIPRRQQGSDVHDVIAAVADYERKMEFHPVGEVFRSTNVPLALLKEYAGLQYVDSVLWVPMLAVMKDRVTNKRLRAALTDNILCEAGATHTSHITLCMDFVKSVGITPFFGNLNQYSELARHPVEMMNAVSGMSQEQIAGWALVSEAVVPSLFKMALVGFEKIPGVDTAYLREHITVDSDEHAQWMLEGIEDMLKNGSSVDAILAGVHLGGRTALSVPDGLYAKFLRGAYAEGSR